MPRMVDVVFDAPHFPSWMNSVILEQMVARMVYDVTPCHKFHQTLLMFLNTRWNAVTVENVRNMLCLTPTEAEMRKTIIYRQDNGEAIVVHVPNAKLRIILGRIFLTWPHLVNFSQEIPNNILAIMVQHEISLEDTFPHVQAFAGTNKGKVIMDRNMWCMNSVCAPMYTEAENCVVEYIKTAHRDRMRKLSATTQNKAPILSEDAVPKQINPLEVTMTITNVLGMIEKIRDEDAVEFVDADDIPSTVEACHRTAVYQLPSGRYAITSSAMSLALEKHITEERLIIEKTNQVCENVTINSSLQQELDVLEHALWRGCAAEVHMSDITLMHEKERLLFLINNAPIRVIFIVNTTMPPPLRKANSALPMQLDVMNDHYKHCMDLAKETDLDQHVIESEFQRPYEDELEKVMSVKSLKIDDNPKPTTTDTETNSIRREPSDKNYQWNWIKTVRNSYALDDDEVNSIIECEREGSVMSILTQQESEPEGWVTPLFPENEGWGDDAWDAEEMRNPDVVFKKYGSCKSASIRFLKSIEDRRNATSVLEDMPKRVLMTTESNVDVPISFVHPLAVSISLYCTIKEIAFSLFKSGLVIRPCKTCGYDVSSGRVSKCAAAMYDLARTALKDSKSGDDAFLKSRLCAACAAVRMCVTAVSCLVRCPTRDVSKFDFIIDKEMDFEKRKLRRVNGFSSCRYIPIGEMFLRGMSLFRNVHYVIGMQARENLVRTRDVHIEFADVYYGDDAKWAARELSPTWFDKVGKRVEGWCVVRMPLDRRMDVMSTIHTMNVTVFHGFSRCIETYLFPCSLDSECTVFAIDTELLYLIQDAILPVMMTYSTQQPHLLSPCPTYPLQLRNYYKGDNHRIYFTINWLRRLLYTTRKNDMDVAKHKQQMFRRGKPLPVHLSNHYRILHILLDAFTFEELTAGLIEPFADPIMFSQKHTNETRIRKTLSYLKSYAYNHPETRIDVKFKRIMQALEMALEKTKIRKTKPKKSNLTERSDDVGMIDFAYFHLYSCLKIFVMPFDAHAVVTRQAIDILEYIFAMDTSLRSDHQVAYATLIQMRTRPSCKRVRSQCRRWAMKTLLTRYVKYKNWSRIQRVHVYKPSKIIEELNDSGGEFIDHEHRWYAWKILRELRILDALLFHNGGNAAITSEMFQRCMWNNSDYYTKKNSNSSTNGSDSENDTWWEDIHADFENISDGFADTFETDVTFPHEPAGMKRWCQCTHCVELKSMHGDDGLTEVGSPFIIDAEHSTYSYKKHMRRQVHADGQDTFIVPMSSNLFPDYELPLHFSFYRLICDERVPREYRRLVFMGIISAYNRMTKKMYPSKNWAVESGVILRHGTDLSRRVLLRHVFSGQIERNVPVFVWGTQGVEEKFRKYRRDKEFLKKEIYLCWCYFLLLNNARIDRRRMIEYLREQDDIFDWFNADEITGEQSYCEVDDAENHNDEEENPELEEPVYIEFEDEWVNTAIQNDAASLMEEHDGNMYISMNRQDARKTARIFQKRAEVYDLWMRSEIDRSQREFRRKKTMEDEVCFARYKVNPDKGSDPATNPFTHDEIINDKLSRCSTLSHVFFLLESMSFFSHKLPDRDDCNRLIRMGNKPMHYREVSRAYFSVEAAERTHGLQDVAAMAASDWPIPLVFGKTSTVDAPSDVTAEERFTAPTFTYTQRMLFPVWPSRIIDPILSSYTESILCVGTTVTRPFSCASRASITTIISEPVVKVDSKSVGWYERVVRVSKYGAMHGEKRTNGKERAKRARNGKFVSRCDFSDDEAEKEMEDQWYGLAEGVPRAWRPNEKKFSFYNEHSKATRRKKPNNQDPKE